MSNQYSIGVLCYNEIFYKISIIDVCDSFILILCHILTLLAKMNLDRYTSNDVCYENKKCMV